MSFLTDPEIKWGPALRYYGLLLCLMLLVAGIHSWLYEGPLPEWAGYSLVLAFLVAGWWPILRMSRVKPGE